MLSSAHTESLKLLEEQLQEAGFHMEPAHEKIVVVWKHQIRAHISLTGNGYQVIPYSGLLKTSIAAPMMLVIISAILGSTFLGFLDARSDGQTAGANHWLEGVMAFLWLLMLVYYLSLQATHKANIAYLRGFLERNLPDSLREDLPIPK